MFLQKDHVKKQIQMALCCLLLFTGIMMMRFGAGAAEEIGTGDTAGVTEVISPGNAAGATEVISPGNAAGGAEAVDPNSSLVPDENSMAEETGSKREIIDKKMTVPQLRFVIRKGKGAVNVRWDKINDAKGYQIQYSTKAGFKGAGLKTVKIGKGSTTSKAITGISTKKDTYIRMRALKKEGGKVSYSKWSAPVRLIMWKKNWRYAYASQVHSNQVTLYYTTAKKPKNITVAINAGHGTKGGSAYRSPCHPDGTPKVTGGSTAQGATYAPADNEGTLMLNGTAEAVYTLKIALSLKEKLLAKGFNVLMLRQDDDSGLDVIGRTVFANNCADCHIAIHYDSSTSDKGAFYCSVPDNAAYRNMTPVKEHWQQHNALGESLLKGLRAKKVKVWSGGSMATDLMQTSFSEVPSVDIEMGDRATPTSDAAIDKMAAGLLKGLQYYF